LELGTFEKWPHLSSYSNNSARLASISVAFRSRESGATFAGAKGDYVKTDM